MKNAILREIICWSLGTAGACMVFSQVLASGRSVFIAMIGAVLLSSGAYIRGRTFR